MADVPSLDAARSPGGWRGTLRLALKTVLLAVLLNAASIPAGDLSPLGRVSLYNSLFPGRLRLPYGDDPARSYNVSATQLDALFGSHVLSGADRGRDELRVVVLGDSSVWGFRLDAQETLSAHLQALALTSGGRRLSFYNVGYPTMSLLKDLVLLERAKDYHPDLIVWLVTLESFPVENQSASPLVGFNRPAAAAALSREGIDPARYLSPEPKATWWGRTVVGRRQELAELFRLQVYGLMWAASGIDYDAGAVYPPRAEDLERDPNFHGFGPGEMREGELAWDVLAGGVRAAGATPLLIINEPIFISHGANSDVRYDTFYPRWAYDAYRQWLSDHCAAQGWNCLDVWHALPPDSFTDSAVHYNPAGAEILAGRLSADVVAAAGNP